MNDDNDWIAENEKRDIKRRMWNRIEYALDHPSKFMKFNIEWAIILATWALSILIIGICIRMLSSVIGLVPW